MYIYIYIYVYTHILTKVGSDVPTLFRQNQIKHSYS